MTIRYLVLQPALVATEYHLSIDMGIIPVRLGGRGWEVFVASDRPPGFPTPIKNVQFGTGHLGSLLCLWRLARAVDVLQLFHFTWRTAVRAWAFRLLNPRGVVYVKLDVDGPTMTKLESATSRVLYRWGFRFALAAVDLFSAESLVTRDRFARFTSRCGNRREVIWIPTSGLELPRVMAGIRERAEVARSSTAQPSGILYVGRIGAPVKRTDVLLEAFRLLRERRGVYSRLQLVGPLQSEAGPMLAEWKGRVAPTTRDALDVVGPDYDRDSLVRRYLGAKVFVMCSGSEAAANAFVEAASCGCLLVGTPVGQIPDVLESVGTGWLVEVGDADGLAEVLETALAERDDWERRGSRIRAFAERYSWDATIDRLMKALERQATSYSRRRVPRGGRWLERGR